MTRQDVVIPQALKDAKEELKKSREERKKMIADSNAKTRQEKQDKKVDGAIEHSKTLFVRNISFDTTEEEFKIFMEKFGLLHYAVLCKVKEL
jgi:RNA recognition motif-containing protein